MPLRCFVGGLVAVFTLIPAHIGSAQDMSQVVVRAQQIAGNVYMLTGAGGNVGLSIGDDGPFLVDDQFAPLTDKIKAAIAELSEGEVRFVVNTHWHGDHTGGNENFGEAGALIVAHEKVRERMSVEQFIESLNNRTPPAPPAALPVITFTESVSFYWNGDRVNVFHVDPAHTDGDAIVHWIEANVVHMGDTFFNGSYPFIDASSGGTIGGMVKAADAVLAIVNPQTKIIPGHGPVADANRLRGFRDMLAGVRDRMSQLIAEGRSEDEVVAAKPTRDLDAAWNPPGAYFTPDQWVRFVYQGLVRNSD